MCQVVKDERAYDVTITEMTHNRCVIYLAEDGGNAGICKHEIYRRVTLCVQHPVIEEIQNNNNNNKGLNGRVWCLIGCDNVQARWIQR